MEYLIAILMQLVQLRLSQYVDPITHYQGEVPISLACSIGHEARWDEVGDRVLIDHEAPGWYWLYYMGGGRWQIMVMYQDPKLTNTPHVSCLREFTAGEWGLTP
jgi:hypothetical protein